MSTDNAGQVLFQVQDLLRNSPLASNESGLLAFQLLVWAQLSTKGKLDLDSTVDAALAHGATGIVDALSRLALTDGPMGQAFGDAARRAQFSGDYIVSAVTAAKRLADGGIFERFSPADVVAHLPQIGTEPVTVPAEVARLMVNLVVKGDQSSVYSPWESSGQFVGALLNQHVSLYVETPFSTPLPALLSLFREAPTEMVLANPLRSPTAIKGGHLQKFDAALSIPPLNMVVSDEAAMTDLYGRFPIKKATWNGLNVLHIVAQTGGKAAIIVANSFLFGPGRDREVREYLLHKGMVEAVIALPAGLFNITNIPSALLLLDTQANCRKVGFVDATRPYFTKALNKGKTTLVNTNAIVSFCSALMGEQSVLAADALDDTLAVVTPVEDILGNEASLQVDRYVMAHEQRNLQAWLRAMPTVALEDLADFHNPIPNKDRNSGAPAAIEVYEVGAADLPSAGYIATPEKTVSVQLSSRRSGNAEEAFLRQGDVLLITKGSVGKVGIVPADVPPAGPGGWVAGQSAIVLRGRGQYGDLRGLGLWMRSQMGRDVLAGITSGATIPMISIQTLRRLQVPVLTLEATHRAVEVLNREAEIQRGIEALRTEQAGLSERLWNELLN
ncbi:N-6 DNA methylase [Dyella telluris]|uniref:site-specific DNA-methyltransferase (adenine-specific) n=1 Tax=Dyella telluris TaxID=2763498 RepID=A0A7G8Q9M1_9GAMM|nr:N-6 DNA methylase [Dyella telluris]QNK03479.1 N-6 DNA methylase [Dyella telluris]